MEAVTELCMVRVALVRGARATVKVVNAADAVNVARQAIGDADRETFLVLLLDTKLFVAAAHIAAVGSLDHCLLHPREVFKAAVVANAASVVIAHNHPSGDPTPSPEDHAMTRRLCRAGELLGICVQDHVIVGHGRVYSFRTEGDRPTGQGRRASAEFGGTWYRARLQARVAPVGGSSAFGSARHG